MDQRIYYGNIDPNALADYLVGVFNPQPVYYRHHGTMAQKVVQGERIYVQIMRAGDWGFHEHKALGLHIAKIAGGVSVNMGVSDWLDLDDSGLMGMLLGVLFFPPLLLIPLVQGLAHSSFPQDVWGIIDNYCLANGSSQGTRAPRGFYCPYCGSLNHPEAAHCHACGAPFNFTPQPEAEAPAQQSPEPVAPVPQPPSASVPPQTTPSPAEAAASGPPFSLVICPNCNATVVPANFCGNCAAPLREAPGA